MSATDLVPVPADPSALDLVPDPGAVMVALVDQARILLAQAKGMEGMAEVIEIKSRAEAIRVYTQQKDMGHEAELSAAEIVRRAERRIGELIREGQADGEIASQGLTKYRPGHHVGDAEMVTVEEATGMTSEEASRTAYPMADGISSEQFEEAIDEAKAEGNLSRANVARKAQKKAGVEPRFKKNTGKPAALAKTSVSDPDRVERVRRLAAAGNTSKQIAVALGVTVEHARRIARLNDIEIQADAVTRRTRSIDSNRVVAETVNAAAGAAIGLDLVVFDDLDPDELEGWVASLGESIKSLNSFHKKLKETTR